MITLARFSARFWARLEKIVGVRVPRRRLRPGAGVGEAEAACEAACWRSWSHWIVGVVRSFQWISWKPEARMRVRRSGAGSRNEMLGVEAHGTGKWRGWVGPAAISWMAR